MIERYLREREPLSMLLVLVDGEIGPTPLDLELLAWVRANEIPHTIVATKHDKVKSSHRTKRKKELAAGCRLDPDDIVWVSAAKGTGIERLRGLMALWLTPPG
jgi:GTP-binding protein